MKARLLGAALALTAAVGCSGNKAPKTSSDAAAVVAEQRESLSDYILEGSKLAVHWRRHASTDTEATLAMLMPVGMQPPALAKLHDVCGMGLDDMFDELTVSATDDGGALIAGRTRVGTEALRACLKSLDRGAKAVDLDGLSALKLGKETFVVHRHGLMLMGSDDAVKDASSKPPTAGEPVDFFEKLGMPAKATLRVFKARGLFGHSTGASLSMVAKGKAIDVTYTFYPETTREADQLKDELAFYARATKAGAAEGRFDGARLLRKVLRDVSVRRSVGGAVVLDATFKGKKRRQRIEQAVGFAGVVAAWQTRVARREATQLARDVVAQIAQHLADHMKKQQSSRGMYARFPSSAPAVPAEVPRGELVEVTPEDWSHDTWVKIKYSPTRRLQHFSYSIKRGSDGRSATIRARGDFDGDGKSSLIEQKVRLGHGGKVVLEDQKLADLYE